MGNIIGSDKFDADSAMEMICEIARFSFDDLVKSIKEKRKLERELVGLKREYRKVKRDCSLLEVKVANNKAEAEELASLLNTKSKLRRKIYCKDAQIMKDGKNIRDSIWFFMNDRSLFKYLDLDGKKILDHAFEVAGLGKYEIERDFVPYIEANIG